MSAERKMDSQWRVLECFGRGLGKVLLFDRVAVTKSHRLVTLTKEMTFLS